MPRLAPGDTVLIRAALFVAALIAASACHAHAVLEKTEPASGAVMRVDQRPARIALRFSEPVEVAPGSIAVIDAAHRRVDRADAHVATDDPGRIEATLGELREGTYIVRWRATSADGHVVRGSYWFAVGFAAAPPADALLGAGVPNLSSLEIGGRWLAYIALVLLAGAPLFRLAVLRPMESRTAQALRPSEAAESKLWLGATVGFFAALLMLLGAQAQSVAGMPLPDALTDAVLSEVLFGSKYGALWWLRLVLGVALGLLLWLDRDRRHAWPSALLGEALIIATSAGSHAAGAPFSPLLAITMDALHLAAAALWLGGLVELALMLPALMAARGRAGVVGFLVRRVSSVFLPTVIVLIATGIYGAWQQVGSFDALVSSAYGQSLAFKIFILISLLAIAADNFFYFRPRLEQGADAERAPRRFLANVRAEALLGGLVLAGAALLTSLPPVAQQAAPAAFELARQLGELRISLRIDPVWVGVSRFQVKVETPAGPAADVRNVALTIGTSGIDAGTIHAALSERARGVFEGEGFYLGMPGVTQIGVAVNRGGDAARATFAVEVPDLNPGRVGGLAALLGLGEHSAAPAERGAPARTLYEKNCAACHGADGKAGDPAQRAMSPRPSDLTAFARWHPDEQLDWLIAHGVPGTSMPGFAKALGAGDRRNLVAYLHELDRPAVR